LVAQGVKKLEGFFHIFKPVCLVLKKFHHKISRIENSGF